MAVRLSLEEPRQSQAQAKKAAESPLGSTSSDEDIDGLIAAVLQDIEIQDAINEGREEGDSDHDDKTADTLDQTNHIQAPPDADDSNKNKPSQPPPQLPQPPPPPPPFIPEMKPRVIPSARPILMSSKSMEIGTKHDGMSWFNLRRHPSESAAVNAIVDKEKKRLVDTKIALTKISLILRDVDEDKNGFVDYEEFGEALRLIDSNINHIEIDQIYSHFVYNEDDELCIELFIDLVHQRCQRRSAVDVDHITPATVLQRSFEFIKSAINKIYDTLREKDEDNDFLIDWSEFEEAMIDLEVNASMTQTYLRSIYRIICNKQRNKEEMNIKLLINDLRNMTKQQQQRNMNYEAILKQYFDGLLPPHVHRARNKRKKKKKKVHTMSDMNSFCGSALYSKKAKRKKKRAAMMTRFNSMSLLSASSILNKTNCSVIVMNALRRELHEVDDNDDGKVDCAEFVEALSTLKSCILPRTVQSKLFCDESELSIAQWMNQVEIMFLNYPTITGDECIQKVAAKEKEEDSINSHYSMLSLQSMRSLPCMDEMKDTDDRDTTVQQIEEIVNLSQRNDTFDREEFVDMLSEWGTYNGKS
eukprot:326084_1